MTLDVMIALARNAKPVSRKFSPRAQVLRKKETTSQKKQINKGNSREGKLTDTK